LNTTDKNAFLRGKDVVPAKKGLGGGLGKLLVDKNEEHKEHKRMEKQYPR
jgi:hypothetical protein